MSFLAVGNGELDGLPPIEEVITCPHCGAEHEIKYGNRILDDGSRVPSDLAYYNCGEKTFLAGMGGKNITSLFKKS